MWAYIIGPPVDHCTLVLVRPSVFLVGLWTRADWQRVASAFYISVICYRIPHTERFIYYLPSPAFVVMAFQGETNAYILGVGMAQFLKPRATRQYTELAFEAGVKAMLDGHITYDDVEAGIACYTSTGPTCTGQRVFYQFGMTNIPIYNTNNACASGSTGLHLARTFVKSGTHDCVLVVGFEQMAAGPLVSNITDRPTPYDLSVKLMSATRGLAKMPKNPQLFGNAGKEYMEKLVSFPSCPHSGLSHP